MPADNALLTTVRDLRASGRAALCGYFLTGYPNPEDFYRMVRAARDLDVIEFGIPALDPALDGPVIASAHEVVTMYRGLGAETSLALIGGLRELRQPRFVMTYADVGRGLEGFLRLCAANDVQGMLAPDLASFEVEDVTMVARALNLAVFTLLDARADDAAVTRAATIGDVVYLKAAPGRTGQSADLEGELGAQIADVMGRLRAAAPDVLVAVGIGVQQPDQVAALARLGVDMVIVGTKIVEHLQTGEESLVRYIRELKAAAGG